MTVLEIDVYDVNNGGEPHRLTQATGRDFEDDLDGFGGASFAVDAQATEDWEALDYGKVCRFVVDGVDRFAGVIRDMPKTLVASPNSPSGWSRVVRCQGLQSWLGYSRGGGIMYPAKGLDGPMINPRTWGPRGFDFPDPGWPEPSVQPVGRQGWPDDRAQSIIVAGKTLTRRVLAATPDRAGDARMWFTSAATVKANVYLDGARIFRTDLGDRAVIPRNHPYDGEEHVLTVETEGEGTFVWAWASMTVETFTDDNGDERERERFEALFRTSNSNDYEGPVPPTEPFWQQLYDYSTYPGVTPGYLGVTVIDENHALEDAQGNPIPLMPNIDYDFDADEDSSGQPWPEEIAHGFRIQEVGRMLDEAAGIVDLDLHVTPTGTLRMWPRRGVDRTGDVTLVDPFEQSESGTGPHMTRTLFETEGGFGEGFDLDAESSVGPMGVVMQFGTGLGPEQIESAVTKTLASEASASDEITAEVPDTVTPYEDFDNGDDVMFEGPDGAYPGRVTSIKLADNPWTGQPEWGVRARA